ncbi:dihydrofolate reductase [Suicoccus acidiformans]|uniref:Dihydrofolate reductase n=1 Tax=Suicoccus acidiformans TaxID=2036206 RepID=A0A347WI53_9LACT|nr:dihydrofolate reductase [Suicoccus acidiformans]AXY24760.1 dihydrofolate reductase [Suicoccus acidiformans]
MLSLIWAQDEQGLIGRADDLPWRLASDMKYFKETTLQGDVLMGRKTYESFPNGPLKDRENMVLTTNPDFQAEAEVLVFHSKEEALAHVANWPRPLYVIGGAQIYDLFLSEADELRVTRIQARFEGDTYFPEVDWAQWQLVESWPGAVDERSPYAHQFEIYRRK